MRTVDRANGFANRFMWIETYWRHDLPFAQIPAWSLQEDIVSNLRNVLTWARESRFMRWSDDGKRAWSRWYKTRSKQGGELGIILKRDRVHILRLAMIYAVLDCREEMTEAHFCAAKAVWDYAAQSARRIFGGSTGNKWADKILWKLQHSGKMTLKEIWRSVSNKPDKIELHQAIQTLVDNGQAYWSTEKNAKGEPEDSLCAVVEA
jgi:hypothetical protein